jgi:wyosine [tRNA(Phe)-imidazoG37] synthetase (radical SAM superfamily)
MGKFTFGPVPSRRLGFSLGVDVIPRKYCSFDCIYCQVGKTTNKEVERKSFFDPEDIVSEIVSESRRLANIDVVTFSGSGEPTLNSDLGWMIKETKRRLKLPVSVITNSSLLPDKKVRFDLYSADVILPSLDAVSEDIFGYVNKPDPLIKIDGIIEGLKRFRVEYGGKIWLEIMLIKGINDSPDELEKMKKVTKLINPDKIQLNTVTRPPIEETARGLSNAMLKKICASFGDRSELICKFEKRVKKGDICLQTEMVSNILSRRSLTLDDIVRITGIPAFEAKKGLWNMEAEGKIKSTCIGGTMFFQKVEE